MILDLTALLLTAFFAVAFAYRNRWQFAERHYQEISILPAQTQQANRKWHAWQFWIQVAFFGALACRPSLAVLPLCVATWWLLFDGLINRIALAREFFYVGKTARIDRFFRRFRCPGLAMALVKIALLLASAGLYLFIQIR